MEMKKLILPGDVLLYWNGGFYGWIIATKTWHKVSHVETYIGNGKVIASRDGQGVATYPLNHDISGLIAIRRPRWKFDLDAVLRWQATVEGYGYDWDGLLAFVGVKAKPDRQMFCSEHAAYAAKISGGLPFCDELPEKIAPFEFLITPAYETIWSKLEE